MINIFRVPLTHPESTYRLRWIRRRHPVVWFIVRRIAAGVITLVAVSALIFVCTQIAGDVATHILGRTSSPLAIHELRTQLNLDHPASRGTSTGSGVGPRRLRITGCWDRLGGQPAPIWDVVAPRLVNSLILAGPRSRLLIPIGSACGRIATAEGAAELKAACRLLMARTLARHLIREPPSDPRVAHLHVRRHGSSTCYRPCTLRPEWIQRT